MPSRPGQTDDRRIGLCRNTRIPAVFPRSVFLKLHALHGDKGARVLLEKPPCPLIALPFEGGEVDMTCLPIWKV